MKFEIYHNDDARMIKTWCQNRWGLDWRGDHWLWWNRTTSDYFDVVQKYSRVEIIDDAEALMFFCEWGGRVGVI
jgi:predicted HNH restriction endonuclease